MNASGDPGQPAPAAPTAIQATSSANQPLAPVPGDEQELQREIERTRKQLGDTVEQLAAKADVRAHAKAKAAELTGRLRSAVGQASGRAAAGGDAARQRGALIAAGASVLLGGYLLRLWWRNR
jgi:Protein of unknown function (DUF3618)